MSQQHEDHHYETSHPWDHHSAPVTSLQIFTDLAGFLHGPSLTDLCHPLEQWLHTRTAGVSRDPVR